jgi:hypothetical protein
MFFVSGKKKMTNNVIIVIQPKKKMKTPYFIEHSIKRNDWAIKKVKSKFVDTAIEYPADLVSRGKISLGMSHAGSPRPSEARDEDTNEDDGKGAAY